MGAVSGGGRCCPGQDLGSDGRAESQTSRRLDGGSEDEPSHSLALHCDWRRLDLTAQLAHQEPRGQWLAQGTDPGLPMSVPTGEDLAGREGRVAVGAGRLAGRPAGTQPTAGLRGVPAASVAHVKSLNGAGKRWEENIVAYYFHWAHWTVINPLQDLGGSKKEEVIRF